MLIALERRSKAICGREAICGICHYNLHCIYKFEQFLERHISDIFGRT